MTRIRAPLLTLALAAACATVAWATTLHDEDEAHHRQLAETAVPFSSWKTTKDTVQYILAFLMVLLAAHPLGVLFPRYFKLPLITGYLIVGIISGPFVANLLPTKLVTMLSPSVNALALSFISFQAGQEIYLPELKPQIKSILTLLVVLYSVTMTILTLTLFFFNNPFFYDSFEGACQLAIALMFGSIAVLGSPATVMAIKIELNSVGKFTNLMLGATMTAEFVVLVSFSISRVVSSIYCAKLDISVANLFFTLGVVLANLVVGAAISLVIIAVFLIPGGPEHDEESAELLVNQDRASNANATSTAQQYITRSRSSRASLARLSSTIGAKITRSSNARGDIESGSLDSDDNMPHPHNAYIEEVDENNKKSLIGRTGISGPGHLISLVLEGIGSLYGKGFLWLLAGYAFYISTNTISEATIAAYGHSWDVKLEPLLVLMTASCLAGHYSSIRHDMHVILDTAAPYIFLPFFVMTGAALKLDQVANAIPLMSLYVILRYVSIFVACYVGGRFVLKLEPREYNNLWLTMTPQAGVALGLANEVKGLSTEPWAAEFAATIVAAVVVNQIIGPVLCAIGLSRAGESYASRVAKALDDNAAAAAAANAMHNNGGASTGPAIAVPGAPLPKVDEYVVQGNGDPRPLLPFYKVNQAVVIGEDEMAFEVALELSLYGAHVNVPLLDEELAAKWHTINETILARSAKGDLIKFKNKFKDVKEPGSGDSNGELHSMAAKTDVVIFTGDAERSLEHAKTMLATFGGRQRCPRLIAVVSDCAMAKQLKDLGVLTIMPSIAMANIATRMALLELDLAQQLSNEISTTSNFSTATYFMRHDSDRDSVHSLSEMRLPARRLALGRSVVNHHNVEYDKVAEALISVNLPPPPPPARVSMFGTTAPVHNPFGARQGGMSVYEHYVVDEADLDDGYDEPREVFAEQFLPGSPNGGAQFERGRSMRRSSRTSGRVVRRSRSGSVSSTGRVMSRTNSSRM